MKFLNYLCLRDIFQSAFISTTSFLSRLFSCNCWKKSFPFPYKFSNYTHHIILNIYISIGLFLRKPKWNEHEDGRNSSRHFIHKHIHLSIVIQFFDRSVLFFSSWFSSRLCFVWFKRVRETSWEKGVMRGGRVGCVEYFLWQEKLIRFFSLNSSTFLFFVVRLAVLKNVWLMLLKSILSAI